MHQSLSMECAEQFRHFMYSIEHLNGIVPNFPDGTKCPVCESTKGKLPMIFSMDGRFISLPMYDQVE